MDATVIGKSCDLFKDASLSQGCTGKTEAGGLNVPGHPELFSKRLSQKTKQTKMKQTKWDCGGGVLQKEKGHRLGDSLCP